jgi:3-methyladenine DNA glycosylase AlkD
MTSLLNELKALGDPAYAKHGQRFFKTGKGEYGEGDLFLGVRVPVIREFARRHHNVSEQKRRILIESKYHEARMAGLIILVNRYQASKEPTERTQLYREYVRSFPFINNWDLVDVACHKIVGTELEHKSRKRLYAWARSKDLWKRRISIISTFWFIRRNDLDDAFQLAEVLLNDQHDLMHKAVGWVLRECGKKDRPRLEKFLDQHIHQMPRTMLRYAIERFPEKKRKAYLKA